MRLVVAAIAITIETANEPRVHRQRGSRGLPARPPPFAERHRGANTMRTMPPMVRRLAGITSRSRRRRNRSIAGSGSRWSSHEGPGSRCPSRASIAVRYAFAASRWSTTNIIAVPNTTQPIACIAAGYDGGAPVPGCHNGRVSTDRAIAKAGTHAPSSWGMGDGQAIPWEYAPAPESRDVVTLEEQYGLFIDGRVRDAADGGVHERRPVHRAAAREGREGDARRHRPGVAAAVRAGRRSWSDLPGKERAKYLYRIARILQERSREFAVLESMDSGKPIKESRDVDVPLVAAHFWYYAGWADKLEYAFPGRVAKPLGVAAQIIPWNFPLLMLAWKIAPALAAGNTVVLKPASTTPLAALLFADVCRQADLPPGVVNIVTGPGRDGHAPRDPQGRRQGRLHRLHRHRQADPAAVRRHGQGADPRARRQGREHRVRGRGARPGGRGDRQRDLLQPGRGVLRRVAAARPGVRVRRARDPLKDRLSTLRVGDPLDKNTDVGAINSKCQLEKITELVAAGEAEGAELYQPACELPERGWFFRPTLFTNVAQSHRIAKEEIFGPVLSVLTFRTPDEAVEKANNTAYGLSAGIWTEKASRSCDGPGDEGGRRVGEHVQPVRPDVALRRLQGVGLRARGRHARPPRVRPAGGPLMPAEERHPTSGAHAATRR